MYAIDCGSNIKKNSWYKVFEEAIEKVTGEMSKHDKRRSILVLKQQANNSNTRPNTFSNNTLRRNNPGPRSRASIKDKQNQKVSDRLTELQKIYEKKWVEYEKQRKIRVDLQYKNKELESKIYSMLLQQSRILMASDTEPSQTLVRYNTLKTVMEEMIKKNLSLQQTLNTSIEELNSLLKEKGEPLYDSDDDEVNN